jgi:predicted PurR-regulated permease PerM
VLIPVAVAGLLAFLLAPAARRLEHFGVGRGIATLLVAVFAFTIIGAVGWIVTTRRYRGGEAPRVRVNITKKIRA